MRNAIRAAVLAAALVPGATLALHATTAQAAPMTTTEASSACASLKTGPTIDADVRAVEKGIGILLGCKDVARDPALAYWTDGPTPSQLARLAVVSDCLPTEMDRPSDLIEALRCYPDLQLLDRTKLDAELESDSRFDTAAKTKLRAAMDGVRLRAEAWRKQATALVAKSPEARAVLFDDPSKALTEWHTAYAANRDGIDAALVLSPRFANEGVKGCSVTMRKHLAAYLAKKDARTVAATTTAMQDSMGYPMVDALARCEQLDGEVLAAQGLSDTVLTKATKWHRGPRVAAYWAGVDAIDASDAAQRIFGASFRVFRRFPRDRAQIAATSATEREQTIASIRTVNGGARITFVSAAAPAVMLSPAHANGLAAGQKLVYLADARAAHAFPLSVYSDADKKNAVAFMGTALVGVSATPPPSAAPERVKARRGPARR